MLILTMVTCATTGSHSVRLLEVNRKNDINSTVALKHGSAQATLLYSYLPVGQHGQPMSEKSYNEMTYDQFTFNDEFNGTTFDEVHDSVYAVFYKVFDYYSAKSNMGELTEAESNIWTPVQQAIWDAFAAERGAISYDDAGQQWMFCGWVDLSHTFLESDGRHMRLCAPVSSCGMTALSREPVPYHDYIARDAIEVLKRRARALYHPNEPEVDPESDGEAGEESEGEEEVAEFVTAQATMRLKLPSITVRQDDNSTEYVNLFTLGSDTYSSECKSIASPSYRHSSYFPFFARIQSFTITDLIMSIFYQLLRTGSADTTTICYIFCCYSAYIGSPFCSAPFNCA